MQLRQALFAAFFSCVISSPYLNLAVIDPWLNAAAGRLFHLAREGAEDVEKIAQAPSSPSGLAP